jgi:hypothetical protein
LIVSFLSLIITVILVKNHNCNIDNNNESPSSSEVNQQYPIPEGNQDSSDIEPDEIAELADQNQSDHIPRSNNGVPYINRAADYDEVFDV